MSSRDNDILYEVVRSRRATADIVVERDGSVVVRVPKQLSETHIAKLVQSRSLWIYKTLAEWRDVNATRVLREYRNGEGFLYLGRSYRLLLTSKQPEALLLKNGRFCLCRQLVDAGGVVSAKTAFKDFYTSRGLERMRQRVDYFASKVGVQPGRFAVRELSNRWASCSPNGNLVFHWKCMMAPATVIDYIIVHELCHLHHLDHSMAFWNEVDKVMPDYREKKEWLRVNGAGLEV